MAEINEKICKQIDFYFSDFNLHFSRFMRTLISENNDGISIEIFMKFNRIKQLLLEKMEINNNNNNNMSNNNDSIFDQDLITTFTQFKFENIVFDAQHFQFKRLKTFNYPNGDSNNNSIKLNQKEYLKSMINSIVFITKLKSLKTIKLYELIEWFIRNEIIDENSFYGIKILKRDNDNDNDDESKYIKSIIIVFKNNEIIDEFKHKLLAIDQTLQIQTYDNYLRYKLMKKRQRRRLRSKQSICKTIDDQLSIDCSSNNTSNNSNNNDDNDANNGVNIADANNNDNKQSKSNTNQLKLKGLRLLISRRSIIIMIMKNSIESNQIDYLNQYLSWKKQEDINNNTNDTIDNRRMFRNYLRKTIGLIYVYEAVKSNNDYYYYLLFKNRSSLVKFHEKSQQKNSFEIFQELFADMCSEEEESNNNEIDLNRMIFADQKLGPINDQFSLIDPNRLPDHFEHYARCVRKFFKNSKKIEQKLD